MDSIIGLLSCFSFITLLMRAKLGSDKSGEDTRHQSPANAEIFRSSSETDEIH